jgi:hypothetical protein
MVDSFRRTTHRIGGSSATPKAPDGQTMGSCARYSADEREI